MLEPQVHTEVILAEIKARLNTLERDYERSIGVNTVNIQKHEKAIEALEDRTDRIEIDRAVSTAEVQGMNKLKWIIVAAIATQLATTFVSFEKPSVAPTPAVRSK